MDALNVFNVVQLILHVHLPEVWVQERLQLLELLLCLVQLLYFLVLRRFYLN